MKKVQNNKPKKSFKKKVFLYGLATVVTGLVSYFGFQFWKKNKEENGETEKAPDPVKQSQGSQKPKPNVKTQPGSTTTNPKASTKTGNGNPPPNDTNTGQSASTIGAALIAGLIHAAIIKKDFTAAFNQLKNIKSVSDYSAVSKVFLKARTAGKPQTLVSGLLSIFKTETQRTALRKAFTAMGLKYDGKKWSLSGIEPSQLLITTQPTRVWLDPQNFVAVPDNMVLGSEIAKRGEFSVFENDKQYFLVETNAVNYYNN